MNNKVPQINVVFDRRKVASLICVTDKNLHKSLDISANMLIFASQSAIQV